jgi:hypothetical protein
MYYTDEQLAYINYNKKEDTKLLACAGSGKTRCIIARMINLIDKKIYKPEEILMLTFSRFTRDDFINKIKTYNGSKIIPSMIKTIDSFANQIIGTDGTIDVSLLSFRLMEFLENEKVKKLKEVELLKSIKIVFVDEAQDLNDIQYRIFCAMKKKLKIIVNMVGDPNQNIYQFRESSDKYLADFKSTTFILTNNFRSYLSVVNFSKHLRPFNEHNVICTKGENDCKPAMMFYEDEKVLEENIIDILTMATSRGIDLSEFAILSPTRGRMRSGGRSHGLCFVANVLYKVGIKFKQFYEEAVDEITGEGIKYEPTKGYVNILTYMGSKGLEWNYVIIIDADTCLVNKRHFNEDKHKQDRYLLYVACSRAIQNMYIFSKCYFSDGKLNFRTNKWFECVPSDLYQLDDRFSKQFSFSNLKYVDSKERNNMVNKIIDKLNCYEMNEISKILDNKKLVSQKKIFDRNYSDVVNDSNLFLAKYTENFFIALYNIKKKRTQKAYPEIENIIDTDIVVMNLSEEATKWYYNNRKNMTWNIFDRSNIPKNIKDGINASFDRTKEFNKHTILLDGFYQLFILNYKTWISNIYKKYLNCRNPTQMREIMFYITIILHGIHTQHYFHIRSKGKKYSHILTDFSNMFDEIENYIELMDHNFIASNEIITRWNINSYVNLIDDTDKIWSIKCSGEITLKYILHNIISNLMYNKKIIIDDDPEIALMNFKNDMNNSVNIDTNFINFLQGIEVCYRFELNRQSVKKLIEIIFKNSNMMPDDMVFDS